MAYRQIRDHGGVLKSVGVMREGYAGSRSLTLSCKIRLTRCWWSARCCAASASRRRSIDDIRLLNSMAINPSTPNITAVCTPAVAMINISVLIPLPPPHGLSQRQLWIRTPGLGDNTSVGAPFLEISSPPQDARTTTFSPHRGKLLGFVVHSRELLSSKRVSTTGILPNPL